MGTEYVVFLRSGERFHKQLSVPFDTREDAEEFARYWSKPETTLVVLQVISSHIN